MSEPLRAVRVKICGITRVQDGMAAAQAGADAVGLVFYPNSKRCVDIAAARAIVHALPPFVSTVGLFVNETAANVAAVLAQVPLDMLQFHGDEAADYCRGFARPYLKAVRVRSGADIQGALSDFADARALLFDAWHSEHYGGTGLSFDWSLLPAAMARPWVLAGGLTPENVAQAVRMSGAAAVDVSGGVEAAPGIKDAAKMAAFVAAAKAGGFQAA